MDDRIALELGSIQIRWYGLFVALGFVAGMSIMRWRARKAGYGADHIPDLTIAAIVGGILGARILYIITYWNEHFREHPGDMIRIDQGGLVFYGGFFGAALAMILWCRLRKLDPWRITDYVAFGLPLGQAFGRLGCFFNGCCFGGVTNGPFGVTYHNPPHHIIFGMQQEAGQIHAGNVGSLMLADGETLACLPVSPVQIYQSLINLAILGVIFYLSRRVRKPGLLFAAYLMLYAVGRFLNEFNRGDYESYVWGHLTNAQAVCLFSLPVGIFIWWWRQRVAEPLQPPEPPADTPAKA